MSNLEAYITELANILGESRIIESLKKLADIEAGRCLRKIGEIKKELALFEEKFQMNSENAWKKFGKGMLGDDMDIMEWMGLYQNLLDFNEYHDRIRNSGILC